MDAFFSGTDAVDARHAELLGVMLGGVEDVALTAQRLAMSPAEVAAWASSLDTRRAVAGVRMLADVQAELALSRLRVHAVNRLAKLALDDDVPVETGRKAAQALLCVTVDRVAGRMPESTDAQEYGVEEELASIRAALFGPPENVPPESDPPEWGGPLASPGEDEAEGDGGDEEDHGPDDDGPRGGDGGGEGPPGDGGGRSSGETRGISCHPLNGGWGAAARFSGRAEGPRGGPGLAGADISGPTSGLPGSGLPGAGAGGDAQEGGVVGGVLGDDGPGGDDAAVAEGDPGQDVGPEADEGGLADGDAAGEGSGGGDMDRRAEDAMMFNDGGGVDEGRVVERGVGADDSQGADVDAVGQRGGGADDGGGMDHAGEGSALLGETLEHGEAGGVVADGDDEVGGGEARIVGWQEATDRGIKTSGGGVVVEETQEGVAGGEGGVGDDLAVVASANDDERRGGGGGLDHGRQGWAGGGESLCGQRPRPEGSGLGGGGGRSGGSVGRD